MNCFYEVHQNEDRGHLYRYSNKTTILYRNSHSRSNMKEHKKGKTLIICPHSDCCALKCHQYLFSLLYFLLQAAFLALALLEH